MSTGDFSQDAYKQLREQYAAEAQNQRDEELAGVDVGGQQLGIETLPVDAPWREKIDNWQYPDGKSSYQDGQQSPDEILQIMRDAAEAKLAEDKEGEGPDFDAMSDDEFEKFIDELVSEDEPEENDEDSEEQEEVEEEETDEEPEEEETEDEEPEEEPEEEEVEEEVEEEEEPEGEGLEADEFDGVGEDEELEEDEEEYEPEEEIGENEEDVDLDVEDVADSIAALREEFENLSYYYDDEESEE